MDDINAEYLNECIAFAGLVRSDAALLDVAREILDLPNHFLGLYDSLPSGARYMKQGSTHSVAHIGTFEGEEGSFDVALSVRHGEPYILEPESLSLVERLGGFNTCSYRGVTVPVAIVSAPYSDDDRIAGFLTVDVSENDRHPVQDIFDSQRLMVGYPDGMIDIYIDPDPFAGDVEVGTQYFDHLHIKV